MGVTIGFEGRLESEEAFDRLAVGVHSIASRHGWSVVPADRIEDTLSRDFDDEEFSITGPVRGFIVTVHDDCDPIRLEFDKNWLVQEFVKTQFAGTTVHRDVVGFFREIEPFFSEFHADDEAEYWETSDATLLERHFQAFDDALAESLRNHPGAEVKVKTPEGRIIDLVVEKEEDPKPAWWQFWRRAN